ncbi:MAG TPA: hypothetical protein VGD78_18485 [Chthoniobacterales bacterium]
MPRNTAKPPFRAATARTARLPRAVPNDQQLFPDAAPRLLDELDDLRRADRALVQGKPEFIEAHPRNGRDPGASQTRSSGKHARCNSLVARVCDL